MPPRHAYWTILVDDQPTAFRAHDAEELLPTFNRLKEKHPSAVMKWFERGAAVGIARRGARAERRATADGDAARSHVASGRRASRSASDVQGREEGEVAALQAGTFAADGRRSRRKASRTHRIRSRFTPPHGDPLRDRDRSAGARRTTARRTTVAKNAALGKNAGHAKSVDRATSGREGPPVRDRRPRGVGVRRPTVRGETTRGETTVDAERIAARPHGGQRDRRVTTGGVRTAIASPGDAKSVVPRAIGRRVGWTARRAARVCGPARGSLVEGRAASL